MSVHSGLTKLLLGDLSGSNIPSFSPVFVVDYFRCTEGVSGRPYSYNVHCISLIAIYWRHVIVPGFDEVIGPKLLSSGM